MESSWLFTEVPRKNLMNNGIIPPRKMVVRNTINNTVLFRTWIAIYSSSFLPFYTVKIKAKATEPRMVPAVDIIVISLAVRIHFEKTLTIYPRTKIAASLETMQTTSYITKKFNEIEKVVT